MDGLELSADTFYRRLSPSEESRVKNIVEFTDGFLRPNEDPYIIAGVGGILRNENSAGAKDIDIAVVGETYTAPGAQHEFIHVETFTRRIRQYFDELAQALGSRDVQYGRKHSSSPFQLWEAECADGAASMRTDIGSFSRWDAKGMTVEFSDSRPIDVQWVFNKNLAAWGYTQGHTGLPYVILRELPPSF